MDAAVVKSCRFGGDVSCGGGRILFATLRPAFASANVRLLGSLLYFCAIELAVLASAIVTDGLPAGGRGLEADEVLPREFRKLVTVLESTAVPKVFRNCP